VVDPVQIQVRGRHRPVKGEPAAFREHGAVLGDHRVAAEDDVLRGLGRPAGDVDIRRVEPAGLLENELAAVVGLGDPVVAGREVEDHLGAGQGVVAARRRGRPEVLADLDREGHPSHLEQLAGREAEFAQPLVGDGLVDARARGKPAPLIEFAVVGQVDLGDRPADPAAVDHERGVVQPAVGGLERGSHEEGRGDRRGLAGQICEPFPDRGQQVAGLEEVFAGIPGEGQLGEQHDRRPRRGGPPRRPQDRRRIGRRVGDPDGRVDGGHPQEAEIAEVHG
jgi:hypothetical protein